MAQYTSAGLGNGGANYNDADAVLKKKIAQNTVKLQSDPTFNQNEVSRTLQVIQNRQAQGLDTSAQQKYLTQNLGYNSPTAISSGMAPSTSTKTASAPTNSNMSNYSDLMTQMKSIANQQPTQFSYDPNNDPAYQAALQRARSNIDAGNSQAQAEMNRRGILNSTITSDRMGEIASNEMGNVETTVLPQLMQQAYQQYLNNQQLQQQQFANLGSLAQMYQGEDQRGIENNFTEANLTGNYVPADAKPIIQNILQLKQQAEAPGITAADRAKLSAQADGLRAQLAAMNIDPSAYGANVTANAAKANPGIRTLAGQQLDLQNRQANLDAANAVSNLTGRVVTPQTDWTGLYRQATNPNAPLTAAQQNTNFNQAMQNRQQNFVEGQQSWQNTFDLAKFDEDVRRYGLDYALQQQQVGIAQQNANTSSGDSNFGRLMDIWKATGVAPAGIQGVTAGTPYSAGAAKAATPMTAEEYATGYLDSAAQYDKEDGTLLNADSIERQILSSGLPANEIYKLYQRYGLPWDGPAPSATSGK